MDKIKYILFSLYEDGDDVDELTLKRIADLNWSTLVNYGQTVQNVIMLV